MTNEQWRKSLGLTGNNENGFGSAPGETTVWSLEPDNAGEEEGLRGNDIFDQQAALYIDALERQQERREDVKRATGILAVELVA